MSSILMEMSSIKKLVEDVLEKYPHTRCNDTDLYFQCLRELGVYTIARAEAKGLNIISVHKIRQKIQNKEGRFKADENTIYERNQRAERLKVYFASNDNIQPDFLT